MNERRLRLTIAACLALPLAAQAQGYPSRPIRSIMTVAGGADIVARLVAQGLSGALGQPVVVETQSGAGGAIGADTVARAAPDGYTIMLTSASALVMNRFLSKSARLDPLGDFTPITKAFETVALVVTSPAFPVNSMRELIEYVIPEISPMALRGSARRITSPANRSASSPESTGCMCPTKAGRP